MSSRLSEIAADTRIVRDAVDRALEGQPRVSGRPLIVDRRAFANLIARHIVEGVGK